MSWKDFLCKIHVHKWDTLSRTDEFLGGHPMWPELFYAVDRRCRRCGFREKREFRSR